MEQETAVELLTLHAPEYRSTVFTNRANAVGTTPDTLRDADPQTALALFYHHYAFNRAGGAQAGYNDIATTALDTVGEIDPDQLWAAFRQGCADRDIGLNERMNHGAVTDAAQLANEHGNLFDWVGRTLETEGLDAAYDDVNAITGVGEKITRFFLRDAVWICGRERDLSAADAPYIQPIDVWIRRAATTIWPDTVDLSDTALSQRIAEECRSRGVSGAAFNQGAWYYGAEALDGDADQYTATLTNGV